MHEARYGNLLSFIVVIVSRERGGETRVGVFVPRVVSPSYDCSLLRSRSALVLVLLRLYIPARPAPPGLTSYHMGFAHIPQGKQSKVPQATAKETFPPYLGSKFSRVVRFAAHHTTPAPRRQASPFPAHVETRVALGKLKRATRKHPDRQHPMGGYTFVCPAPAAKTCSSSRVRLPRVKQPLSLGFPPPCFLLR